VTSGETAAPYCIALCHVGCELVVQPRIIRQVTACDGVVKWLRKG